MIYDAKKGGQTLAGTSSLQDRSMAGAMYERTLLQDIRGEESRVVELPAVLLG